jgi:superfamily II DNA or RNA helicase
MSFVDKICKKYDFPFKPLAYQRDTIDSHVEDCIDHVGLYWGVGSGKTFSSTLLNTIYREQTGAQVIQVCPPILLRQWSKWLSKCGITHKVYTGAPKQRQKITFDRDTEYFLMTIDVLKRDFDRITNDLGQRKLMVCVDEATSIKNFESANFRAILQLSSGQGIVLMTGTPISSPRDTYAYVKLISPGVYRSFRHFENIHVAQRDFFGNVSEWQNLEVMKSNLALRSSFISTPEANPDMPRARIGELEYELEKHHLKLYRELVDKQLLIFEDGGAIDASTPQALYQKTQQIVINYGHFAQQNDLIPAGFEVLDEILQELGKAKLVVFANYRMSVRAITDYLTRKGVVAVQVNGDVTQREKDAAVERFKEDPACQVIVMNPKSGGTGVDGLQYVTNDVLFMEVPTVPADFHQGVGRVERPGQKYVTNVRIATALGTVQVRLRNKLLSNDELINTVVPSLSDLRAALYGE